jgi:hypothetical protein
MNLDSVFNESGFENTKIMTCCEKGSTKFEKKNDSLHPCPVHIVSICAIINLRLNPDKAKKILDRDPDSMSQDSNCYTYDLLRKNLNFTQVSKFEKAIIHIK